MTYEMFVCQEELGGQKTFYTSESIFIIGPVLFSSDEHI